MPELPEVETIRRSLLPHILNKPISSGKVLYERILQNIAPEDFFQIMVGNRFLQLTRRGKYLLFTLEKDWVLVAHLRMTGRLLYVSKQEIPLGRHTSLYFAFQEGGTLRLEDVRKFATVNLLPQTQLQRIEGLASLGVEPLSEQFSLEVFQKILEGSSAKIKGVLLDQRRLAGLGNIYSDESLFLAGIHPERAANSLNAQEQKRLYAAIILVLEEALFYQGTTLRDYRTGRGGEGSFQNKLQVYGKKGEQCPRCGSDFAFKKVAGRTSHFCPVCQKE